MLCFICKRIFHSLTLLIYHFKKHHDLTTNSTYKCYESSCGQIFQRLSSFKKHVNKIYLNFDCTKDIKKTSSNAPVNDQNYLACENVDFVHSDDEKNDENTQSQSQNFNFSSTSKKLLPQSTFSLDQEISQNKFKDEFELSKKKLNKLVVEFVVSLHNNNNFTREDVVKIQKCANECLIEPLLNIFISFAKCSFYQHDALYNEFCSIVSQCRDPFKKTATDYLLFKFLENEGYFGNIKEFVIGSAMQPLHHSGKLVNDEKTVTGVLMPLRFQIKKFFEGKKLLTPTYIRVYEVNRKE